MRLTVTRLADTPAAAVILDGLMRGKNVIVATDGCCPDHAERARRGFRMAEPLKQTLRTHLEALRDAFWREPALSLPRFQAELLR